MMLNVHTSRDIAGDAADCPSWGKKIKEEREKLKSRRRSLVRPGFVRRSPYLSRDNDIYASGIYCQP